jgi:hypothetical protein
MHTEFWQVNFLKSHNWKNEKEIGGKYEHGSGNINPGAMK